MTGLQLSTWSQSRPGFVDPPRPETGGDNQR